jgi:hypothetical protein
MRYMQSEYFAIDHADRDADRVANEIGPFILNKSGDSVAAILLLRFRRAIFAKVSRFAFR